MSSLDDYPPESIPSAKKVSAFVAYRRSHAEAAKTLHGLLQSHAAATLFDPYLDLHDMQSGDWEEQIYGRIDTAEVFVCLVSPDYADADSFGLKEYQRGVALAAQRGWTDFFQPVFMGSPATEVGVELERMHGFMATSIDDLSVENPDFEAWIGVVAQAGLSRDTANGYHVLQLADDQWFLSSR